MDILLTVKAFLNESSSIVNFAAIFQLGCALNIALDRWKLKHISIKKELNGIGSILDERIRKMELPLSEVMKLKPIKDLKRHQLIITFLTAIFSSLGKYLAILIVIVSFALLLHAGFSPDETYSNFTLLVASFAVTALPIINFYVFHFLSNFIRKRYKTKCDDTIENTSKIVNMARSYNTPDAPTNLHE